MKILWLFFWLLWACAACDSKLKSTSVSEAPMNTEQSFASCQLKWAQWHKRYTSSSFIVSFNNNSDWKISKENLKSAMDGSRTIKFMPPYEYFDKELAEIQLDTMNPVDGKRNKAIVNHINTIITEYAQSENSLVLILAGAFHTAELYFQNPFEQYSYASYRLGKNLEMAGNSAFQECIRISVAPDFQRILDNFYGPHNFIQAAIEGIFRAVYNTKINNELPPVSEKQIFLPVESRKNIIIMNDLHAFSDLSIVNDFPSPQCLKKLGFISITLGLESFSFEKPLSREKIIQKFNDEDLCAKHLQSRGLMHNPVYANLLSKAKYYPIWLDLVDSVEKAKKVGIKISYVGLE